MKKLIDVKIQGKLNNARVMGEQPQTTANGKRLLSAIRESAVSVSRILELLLPALVALRLYGYLEARRKKQERPSGGVLINVLCAVLYPVYHTRSRIV